MRRTDGATGRDRAGDCAIISTRPVRLRWARHAAPFATQRRSVARGRASACCRSRITTRTSGARCSRARRARTASGTTTPRAASEAASRFGTAASRDLDALLERMQRGRDLQRDRRTIADLSKRAARRGLAVLCEKPLGTASRTASASSRTVADRRHLLHAELSEALRSGVALRCATLVVDGQARARITLVRVRHGHFYGLQPDFRERWYVARGASPAAARCSTKACTPPTCWRGCSACRETRGREVSHEALGAGGRGPRRRGLPLGHRPDRRDHVELHVRCGGHVDRAVRDARGRLLLSGVDLASRDITRRLSAPGCTLTRAGARAGRRSTSCRASRPGEFHHQNAIAFVDALARGQAAADHHHRRPERVRLIMPRIAPRAAGAHGRARNVACAGDRRRTRESRHRCRDTSDACGSTFASKAPHSGLRRAPAKRPRLTVSGARRHLERHAAHRGPVRSARRATASARIAPCLFRGAGIPARDAPPEVLAQTFLDFDDRRCVRDLRAVDARARAGRARLARPAGSCRWDSASAAVSRTYWRALGEHVAGVVNFYGRLRFARQPTKPFLPIELTGADRGSVPRTLRRVRRDDSARRCRRTEALRWPSAASRHEVHVYGGARHGFVDPERPTEHDPERRRCAWSRTLDFLDDLQRESA